MYVIIWEYQVKADSVVEFERIYASNGVWAELFRKEDGYLGTELLRDSTHPRRYITIDRWTSSGDYESFRSVRWPDSSGKGVGGVGVCNFRDAVNLANANFLCIL